MNTRRKKGRKIARADIRVIHVCPQGPAAGTEMLVNSVGLTYS